MAPRPNTGSRETLTTAELEALRLRLAAMKQHELEIFYKATQCLPVWHQRTRAEPQNHSRICDGLEGSAEGEIAKFNGSWTSRRLLWGRRNCLDFG
jgi:hypothetical protein